MNTKEVGLKVLMDDEEAEMAKIAQDRNELEWHLKD